MMMKRRQTTALATLLFDEEEAREYKTHENQKGSWSFQSWLQWRGKKCQPTTVFLSNL